MNKCIIKLHMILPDIANEEDILHANLDYMIDIFGENFNIVVNNYSHYYYLLIMTKKEFTLDSCYKFINILNISNEFIEPVELCDQNNIYNKININNYKIREGVMLKI